MLQFPPSKYKPELQLPWQWLATRGSRNAVLAGSWLDADTLMTAEDCRIRAAADGSRHMHSDSISLLIREFSAQIQGALCDAAEQTPALSNIRRALSSGITTVSFVDPPLNIDDVLLVGLKLNYVSSSLWVN